MGLSGSNQLPVSPAGRVGRHVGDSVAFFIITTDFLHIVRKKSDGIERQQLTAGFTGTARLCPTGSGKVGAGIERQQLTAGFTGWPSDG